MKHIFTDVDGTLVYRDPIKNETILPPKTLEALNLLRSKGHKIYLSSGRNIISAKDVIKDFIFDGYISGVGSYAEINNKVIYDNPFKYEEIVEIITVAKKYKIELVLEGNEKIFVSKTWAEEHKKYRSKKDISYWKDLESYSQDDVVYKLLFKAREKSDFLNFEDEIREKYAIFHGINHGFFFGEITLYGNNKGAIIRKLVQKGLIKYEDTIAIGDSPNDIEMFNFANLSIALGNANEKVKRQADLITKDIKEDGFYCIFKELGLYE